MVTHVCRKGRCKEAQKGAQRQHPGNHQASNQKIGSPWRCQAYLWLDLRGDQKCPESVPGECDQRCSNLHWACTTQDSHSIWCCLCPQKTGQDTVWIWRINPCTTQTTSGDLNHHQSESLFWPWSFFTEFDRDHNYSVVLSSPVSIPQT